MIAPTNYQTVVSPTNYATPADFTRAALSRFLDYMVKTGELGKGDAQALKRQRIRMTGIPVNKKPKKTQFVNS